MAAVIVKNPAVHLLSYMGIKHNIVQHSIMNHHLLKYKIPPSQISFLSVVLFLVWLLGDLFEA
jgi:hypothetical protein